MKWKIIIRIFIVMYPFLLIGHWALWRSEIHIQWLMVDALIGCIIATFTGYTHILNVDQITQDGENRYQIRQKCTLTLAKNFETCISLAEKAIQQVSYRCNLSIHHKTGVLKARTRASLLSLGENIRIDLDMISVNKTRITIISRPVFPFQIIDYGKNLKNVMYLQKRICRY